MTPSWNANSEGLAQPQHVKAVTAQVQVVV